MSVADLVASGLSALGHEVTSTLTASYDGDPNELARVEFLTEGGGASVVEHSYRTRGGDDLFLRDVDDPADQANRERLRLSRVERKVRAVRTRDAAPPVSNADYARVLAAVRSIDEEPRRLAMSATEGWPGSLALAEARETARSALSLAPLDSECFPLALAFVEDLASGAPLEWVLRRHALV